jgi:hypothetical protein
MPISARAGTAFVSLSSVRIPPTPLPLCAAYPPRAAIAVGFTQFVLSQFASQLRDRTTRPSPSVSTLDAGKFGRGGDWFLENYSIQERENLVV